MAAPTPQHILVIDDDPDLIAHISDTLRLLGHYEVTTAADGIAGIEAFFTRRPDCVVVDVRMPHLTGLQVVRALRGDQNTAQTPIIVLSALVQDDDELAGMLSGADLYLRKPVRVPDLLEAVKGALAISQSAREAKMLSLLEDEQ